MMHLMVATVYLMVATMYLMVATFAGGFALQMFFDAMQRRNNATDL